MCIIVSGRAHLSVVVSVAYINVTAERVLPGILKIRETLPEIPVDDSGDNAFRG